MRRILVALLLVAGVLLAPTAAMAGGGSTAVPSDEVDFGSGTAWECTANFVRSSSGIINETERVCGSGPDSPWTSLDVWVQFRPIGGRPNSACDMDGGLIYQDTYVNDDPALNGYFVEDQQYTVCFYLVDPVVASGTVSSNTSTPTTVNVPTDLDGRYRIAVSGTFTNNGHGYVDAEYVEQGAGTGDWIQGWPDLGEGFGDLMFNGTFIDWGGYTGTHAYSHTATINDSFTLMVFDGDADTSDVVPEWYGDNVGSLNYTVTYLGPIPTP